MSALSQLFLHFAWYAGLVFVLSRLERHWPAGEQATTRERLFNFELAGIAAFTTSIVLNLGDVSRAIRQWIGVDGALATMWVPSSWWEWLLGSLGYLLLWDFLQYWYHRIQHVVPALWPTHALHHDSEAMNASDALRSTLWHHIGTTFLITMPIMIVAGNTVIHPYAAWFFLLAWGFYNHANLRWSHGPLTRVISGPQWHRLHHGKARQYYNCNYAALFPVIDIVFGTYKAPAADEFPETGLMDRRQSAGDLVAIFAALVGRSGTREMPSEGVDSRKYARAPADAGDQQ